MGESVLIIKINCKSVFKKEAEFERLSGGNRKIYKYFITGLLSLQVTCP